MNKVQKYFQNRKTIKEQKLREKNASNYLTKEEELEVMRRKTEALNETKDLWERKF